MSTTYQANNVTDSPAIISTGCTLCDSEPHRYYLDMHRGVVRALRMGASTDEWACFGMDFEQFGDDDRDLDIAVTCFTKAAEAGDKDSMQELVDIYACPECCLYDKELASHWAARLTKANNDNWAYLEATFGSRYDYETNIEGRKGAMQLRLMDCAYQAAQQSTFQIPSVVEDEVKLNSLVKVMGMWEGFNGEGFWVEVTDIATGTDGRPSYYGKLKNRTFGADWGARIGPFQPRHICDIDYDWVSSDVA